MEKTNFEYKNCGGIINVKEKQVLARKPVELAILPRQWK
jgi:hypothetical protein